MAANIPDTATLTSSEQVFTSYTLPQIRAIHKTLHGQIDDKSARLRTQVGNSYRDLLGTADTIVAMRGDMRHTQDLLAHMGGSCGRTVVSGKVGALGRFQNLEGRRDGERERTGLLARVKLLLACRHTFDRLLKGGKRGTEAAGASNSSYNGPEGRGDRLVLAAKVLVLSRLLISSFGDADSESGGNKENNNHDELRNASEEIREAVAASQKNLERLRRRLRRAVEKTLERVGQGADRGEMLKALRAYSLASSSGARDVLWHFLNVRAQALALEFEFEEEHERPKGPANVLKGLDIYAGTLLDVQALVPRQLSDGLAELKKKPLLADESLQELETLRLDVYERWCRDEIQYFTPFIRHDDMDGSQAREMLMRWAKSGGETLLDGLTKTLEHMTEFKAIVDLRTNVLQHWIRHGGKARGFDPSVLLDGMRKAINGRLLEILDLRITKLRLVGSEVAATLDAWKPGITDQTPSLWSDDMLRFDVTDGANQFMHEVTSRLHGQNDAVGRAVTCYQSWFGLIDEVGELVEQLRRQRWDNDMEEIEDEETIEARQKILSKEDPQLLQAKLDATLRDSYEQLDAQLRELWQGRAEGHNAGHVAMYILRILRGIRSQMPEKLGSVPGTPDDDKEDILRTFGTSDLPVLREKMAAHVLVSPLEEFATALTRASSADARKRRRVPGRALWEGDAPPLPSQPSPGTVRLLRNLVMAMSDAGLDLWTPTAVRTLKTMFAAQLADVWEGEPESLSSSTGGGAGKSEDEDEDEDVTDEKKEKKAAEVGKKGGDGDDSDAAAKKNGNDQKKESSEEDGEKEGSEKEGSSKDAEGTEPQAADNKPSASSSPGDSANAAEIYRKDTLTQWLFDVHFLLQCAELGGAQGSSSTPSPSSSPLVKLADDLFAQAGLDAAARARVVRGSQEYWKRTSLLFGLLA